LNILLKKLVELNKNMTNGISNIEEGRHTMKLICKCGNIEDLKSDNKSVNFEFKNCDDGTILAVCKKCNEVIFIKLKNS